ncbi:MAG: HNH endonuclease [Deltaproteobacteria bacterium]|nr:HNH endonuclease [Deltaproteobacteria bacterium]
MADPVLLLNASYEPMLVIPWQRAVTMLCVGKVEVLRSYEDVLRSMSWTLPMPAVVRLRDFVRRHRRRIALTRRNIFVRDRYACQYCDARFKVGDLTIDHVVPRSQGGAASWENLATSCGPCNRRKGGRTPKQARMKLMSRPSRPDSLPMEYALNIANRNLPEPWGDFLAGWTSAA